jgi:hypothetical protein
VSAGVSLRHAAWRQAPRDVEGVERSVREGRVNNISLHLCLTVDIILEEVKKVFNNTDEGKLAERLILAYREGGSKAAKAVLIEYLKTLGVDVEVRED